MTSILIASILLASVASSEDRSTIVLTFDAPVTWAQTFTGSPPGLLLTIEEAGMTVETAASALDLGFTVTAPSDGSGTLRIGLPLSEGEAVTVSGAGESITIRREARPPLIPARPVSSARPAQGGIAGPSLASGGLESYLIGPEDLLEVNVFELPELKTTTRVLGDGSVSLPLLGVVQAAGLTKTGLETRLKDLLEERFLLDPQVTIAITEHKSRQVSVIGAVTDPGTYQMIGPRTLLQLLSEAGGLTKEAGSRIIILRRAAGGGSERLELDLDDLVIHGNPALNLPLEPGDVINVPIDRPIYVYVDGAVKSPGQIEGKSSRPITLLQAIARAGGLTERAAQRGVHVLRKEPDGSQTRIPVNLREIRKGKSDDMILRDGDVIVVPETFF